MSAPDVAKAAAAHLPVIPLSCPIRCAELDDYAQIVDVIGRLQAS